MPVTRRTSRRHNWRTIAALGAPAAGIIAAILVAVFFTSGSHASRRAIIVDQLAATDPNAAFVQDASDTLQRAGYQVDYVPPESVTVDFYRKLPALGYDLVILRSHATQYQKDLADPANKTQSITLFTNQPYDARKYVDAQRREQLLLAAYADSASATRYFAVGAPFVKDVMEGQFPSSTVILMGCGGLSGPMLADAFLQRGVRHFVSWDNSVTAQFTDSATTVLLHHFTSDVPDIDLATTQTMTELGPDTAFDSYLRSYP